MNVQVTGPYIYFSIELWKGFSIQITQTTLSLILVTAILCIASVILGKNLQKRPTGRQVLVEKGIMMMYHMVADTMGAHNTHWTPYIITIFLSSICGSLIGLLGFFRSTTADLSVPLTWALMTTGIIWYQSIKHNGFAGWLKGFTEPVVVMTPMNIISEIAQPISMAFRHFGNVAGGGVITSILYTALSIGSALVMKLISASVYLPIIMVLMGILGILVGMVKKKTVLTVLGWILAVPGALGLLEFFGILSGVPILQFGIPGLLSLYFDIFSGFVQAFVFSLLSMVYIAGACPPPEDAEN